MANEISTRTVDLAAMTSSPECLALRRISLGTVNHPGQPTRRYLSGGLTLTDDDRLRIGRMIEGLRAVSEADDSTENRKARLALVANMLMAYPMANGSEEAGRARASAYLVALDDVPPWAIADAIRRWHRSECGEGHNYRWAPAPAELRQVSLERLRPAKDTIAHLSAVLDAMTVEQAVDPKPIPATVKSAAGNVVQISMRKA